MEDIRKALNLTDCKMYYSKFDACSEIISILDKML